MREEHLFTIIWLRQTGKLLKKAYKISPTEENKKIILDFFEIIKKLEEKL